MKISHLVIAILPACALAWGNFYKAPAQTDMSSNKIHSSVEVSNEFNPSELLDARSRKPEVYTKAMLELKRLEDHPICHRLAAQLLMNNCRGLENMDDQDYQWNSVNVQRNHIESFAASLTMCDMERARFDIPQACTPFSSHALQRAARDKESKLEISSEQVGGCLQALGRDHSHWNTWLSYRDKSLLFCRAARLDIDKDQAIILHKQLAEIMERFSKGLHEDLGNLREKFVESEKAAESYFEHVLSHANNWKAKIHDTFESVAEDAKGANTAMRSIISSSNNAVRVMEVFVQTVIQGNAEMASEQQQAMEVTTNAFQHRVAGIDELVGETESSVMVMKDVLTQLIPIVTSLHNRQDALEQKSQAALIAIMNASELLQSHVDTLNQASSTATDLNEHLDMAVKKAQAWSETSSLGTRLPDWTIRSWVPMGFLVFGNFGHAASLAINVKMLIIGALAGEGIIQSRRLAAVLPWYIGFPGRLTAREPTSVTQKARQKIVTSLADLDPSWQPIYDEADDHQSNLDMPEPLGFY